MVEIKHLSIAVENPEKAARALAEMTEGFAKTFTSKNMKDAWVCIWDADSNHLIEFLPKGYVMYPTEYGADFKKIQTTAYNSTHCQLEISTKLQAIQSIADRYGFTHKFRPTHGGPLYDVWFEEDFLVEFVSDEIRALVSK